MRFDLDTYGQDVCHILARSWCHKMQFLFDAHTQHPGDLGAEVPLEEHHYEEPSELMQLAASAVSALLQSRIAKLRGVKL